MNLNRFLEEAQKYQKAYLPQSIQFNLTPTTKTLRQNSELQEQSWSLLSLSNYLQRQSQSVCTNHIDHQNSAQNLKNDYSPKNDQKNLIRQKQNFQIEAFQQNSESLLLLDSQIRLNDIHSHNHIELSLDHQAFFEDSKFDNVIVAKSCQLLNLLSLQSNNPVDCKSNFEIQKLKQIYKNLLVSNEQLLKKMTTIQQRQCLAHQVKQQQKCLKCSQLFLQISQAKSLLLQKTKELNKYQTRIQKINQQLFQLKVDKKNLQIQNKHLLAEIEKILNEKYQNYFQKSGFNFGSFDERKETQCQDYYSGNSTCKSIESFAAKTSPWTPLQVSKLLKNSGHSAHSRNNGGNADLHFQRRISQVKEPHVKELEKLQIGRLVEFARQQQTKSPGKMTEKYSPRPEEYKHKSQKEILRFSDFNSKPISGHFEQRKFLKRKDVSLSVKDPPQLKVQKSQSQCSQTPTEKMYGRSKVVTEPEESVCNVFKVQGSQRYKANEYFPRSKPQEMTIPEKKFKSFEQIGKLKYGESQKEVVYFSALQSLETRKGQGILQGQKQLKKGYYSPSTSSKQSRWGMDGQNKYSTSKSPFCHKKYGF